MTSYYAGIMHGITQNIKVYTLHELCPVYGIYSTVLVNVKLLNMQPELLLVYSMSLYVYHCIARNISICIKIIILWWAWSK